MLQTDTKTYYFNTCEKKSIAALKAQLIKLFETYQIDEREIVLLCIGSDRSTGDSLGPLVGYKLNKFKLPGVYVYGTLNDPVHAANLDFVMTQIQQKHLSPFIIAIDASLGTVEHIGYITVGTGPLHPGLGVNKTLSCVGDMHLTGIVNFSGMMESLLLQTTRLSKVMQLADIMTAGLLYGLSEYLDINFR